MAKSTQTQKLLAPVREQESEHLLAELEEAQRLAKIGSWSFDLNDNRLSWSKEHYRIFEIPNPQPEGALYQLYRSRIHPDDLATLDEVVEGAKKKGKGFTYKHRVLFEDGRTKYVEGVGSVTLDKNGTPVRVTGTCQDITEKVRAEAAVRDSETRMKRAQSFAHLGDWEHDLITNDLVWSDEMFRLVGLPPGDARGTFQNFLARVHPDDRQAVIDLSTRSTTEGKLSSAEYRLVRDDGTHSYILATAELTQDDSGRPIRLSGTAQDISEIKRAEESLRKSTQALQLSEEQMLVAQELGHTGSWIYTLETDKIWGSIEGHRIFGYPPVAGDWPIAEIEACIPERERVHQALVDLINEGREYKLEYSINPADGSPPREIVSIAKLEKDAHGNPLRVLGFVQDITERKEIEKERARLLASEKEARATAEKANVAKDQFLAMLSHELRTPLSSILTWSQLLRRGGLDAEKSARGLEAIEQNAKAQSQLIDDLLDISRIQAGKLKLTIQKVTPSKVIAAAIDSTRNLAAAKSVHIETTTDPLEKPIFVDPTRLQQILWNLITNAIKFSPNGGKIWIKYDRVGSSSGELMRIQVTDNGKGIKPEFLPIIFKPFTQVDSTSTRIYGGLGLGLAIVRNFVEMHGGTVTVESAGEGQGATFTVCIPIQSPAKIETAEARSDAQAEASAEAGVTLSGIRILLVDDEASAREAFSIMLQSFDADIRTAESASQALAMLEEFKTDVLVSDIAMPVEDGYSLIAKVRALKSKLGEIPALALTAYAGEEDIQRAHLAGFQSHMAKPVDSNRLALAIARIVGRK